MSNLINWILDVDFSVKLLYLRTKKGLTQQQLSELVGVKVLQIRRYETNQSQPTLGVIKKLAIALNVTADELIFDSNERDPSDDLKLQFEALKNFTDDEKHTAREVLESLILKHNARRAFEERTSN